MLPILARRRPGPATAALHDDAPPDPARLETVQRRLELLAAALYGTSVRIDALPAAPRPPWTRRALRAAVHAVQRAVGRPPAPPPAPLPRLDGATIRLPAVLPVAHGTDADEVLARWRVLALGQAERLARGSAAAVAAEPDRLVRALHALAEGAAADAALVARARNLAPALADARRAALADRPPAHALSAAERDVEALLCRVLAAPPDRPPPEMGDATAADAAASLAWARATAAELRARWGPRGDFRAVPPVPAWGAPPPPPRAGDLAADGREAPVHRREPQPPAHAPIPASADDPYARAVDAPPSDDAAGAAAWVEAPARGPDGALRDAGRSGGVESPDAAEDAPVPRGERPGDARSVVPAGSGERVDYPEWDVSAGRLVPRAVTVHVRTAPEGDAAAAEALLAGRAAIARHVRARFEPLRARRARLPRQRAGDALDVQACVDAHADRLAGHASDDERLYLAVRPARRPLAICVLVDVSGSTDARISADPADARQVIDVEREAVLLAGEALEALGDPYAVLTFSSRGARGVHVRTVKDFGERPGPTVRARIAAIAPDGNTRLGAAMRHATARLARQPAGRRLLLLLSDGRPNDMDRYQGRYAVEDARQAVHEARAAGVVPFCLTVDREEPEYLAHVFGVAGHTILRRPDQLPAALVGLVRHLLADGTH